MRYKVLIGLHVSAAIVHLISTISGEGIDRLINEILNLKNI